MRILRVAAMLIALVAALGGAFPAAAGESGPSIELSVGWGSTDGFAGGSAAQPAWIPFTALVTLPAGRPELTGTVVIKPREPVNGGFCAYGCGAGVTYKQTISVRPGTPKAVVVYGLYQFDSAPTYLADLIDSQGVTIATSSPASLRPNYVTLGILSDAASIDSAFKGVVLGVAGQAPQVRGHRFEKTDGLPSNALALTGFHALVIDDFDTTTLSQAQVKALEDYVGFGGSLIVSGGAGWRRTLAQLPAPLVPLRPDATGTASLNAVAELTGGTSELVAPVAIGALGPGARVVLADAFGTPLIVEASYGSGRVVELTYDPALDPVVGTPLVVQTWTQVVNRAAALTRSGGGFQPIPSPAVLSGQVATVTGSAAAGLVGPGGQVQPVATQRFGGGLETQAFSVLAASPQSTLPPLGLLGALLVGYVILAGPANYLFVRRRRRRELTWVTVPLIAVLFTGVAYGVGSATKGSDFIVNEIQLLRVAPGGSVDATMLDAVFNSRRGDFLVQAPDGSFASPAGQTVAAAGARADHVNPGRRTTVALNDVQLWSERSIKVETSVRAAINLEAHLAVSGLRLKGTVTNRGNREVRDVALLTVSGEWATLGRSLAPGATMTVDTPLGRIPDYSGNNTVPCSVGAKGCSPGQPCIATGAGCAVPNCNVGAVGCQTVITPATAVATGDSSRTILAEVAAGASVMGRQDIQALVGIVDALPGITIQDRSPNRHSVAAIAEPILLETMDALPAGWAGARLVSSLSTGGSGASLSVWDFELPARIRGTLILQYGTPGVPAPIRPGSGPTPSPTTVEVYDWTSRHWSGLTAAVRCSSGSAFCSALSEGQSANGLVRVRTRNSPFNNFQVQLVSSNGGAT